MSNERQELIDKAKSVVGEFRIGPDFTAASVGAALRTASGAIYTGVCFDITCGLGFCAEVSAIAQMLTHRETHIVSIVAVSENSILSPCGRCRETIVQVDLRNLDCLVILSEDRDIILRELIPHHWLDE